MPKETIGTDNAVEVSWGKDSETVQIATYDPERLVTFTAPVADARNTRNKKEILTISDQEELPFTGWYTYLNRSDLNNLIRVLRKARDQAYGADE